MKTFLKILFTCVLICGSMFSLALSYPAEPTEVDLALLVGLNMFLSSLTIIVPHYPSPELILATKGTLGWVIISS